MREKGPFMSETAYARFEVRASTSVVICTLGPQVPTMDDVVDLFANLRSLMQRRQKFRMVFDSTEATTVPMAIARRVSAWMSDNEPLIRDWWMGTGIVITSPVIRGLLNVIFTIKKPISPYKITSTLEEAVAFVETLQ